MRSARKSSFLTSEVAPMGCCNSRMLSRAYAGIGRVGGAGAAGCCGGPVRGFFELKGHQGAASSQLSCHFTTRCWWWGRRCRAAAAGHLFLRAAHSAACLALSGSCKAVLCRCQKLSSCCCPVVLKAACCCSRCCCCCYFCFCCVGGCCWKIMPRVAAVVETGMV